MTGESSIFSYRDTMKMEAKIKSLGYRLVTIWGHEFSDLLKSNPQIKSFVEGLDIVDRLDPRYI
jgi:hypothetical protein